MASKYVLVEWESDSTVSGVPTSCLKTRDGKHITQSWPGGVYAGTILQEGGTKGMTVTMSMWVRQEEPSRSDWQSTNKL